jgi:hydroxymethylpyrimidine pyrophosphatase-like HAD family hydrolase
MAASSVPCSTATADEYAEELYETVLSARKAGNIVVIGTDIDGTLIATPGTGEMGILPEDVYQALKTLQKDPNLLVVPATGRVLADALTAMRHLPGAVVAFDGGVVRTVDGELLTAEFPDTSRFWDLSSEILASVPGVTHMEKLLPAIGLSFDKRSMKAMAAYEEYLPQFEGLSEACYRNLLVFPHEYADCREIIVQDGRNTKVTGLERVLSALRESRRFHGKFLVFTHGNSSNDIGMLVWANELTEGQEQPGGSVWVGDQSNTAKYCLKNVEIFQQALIKLAGKIS